MYGKNSLINTTIEASQIILCVCLYLIVVGSLGALSLHCIDKIFYKDEILQGGCFLALLCFLFYFLVKQVVNLLNR